MRADKIFVNGRIYTVNPEHPWAEAVAVYGNKIIEVGTNEIVQATADDSTQVIDLEGRMMTPGLIDAHCHVIAAAFVNTGLVLDFMDFTEEMMAKIKKYVDDNPNATMYFGRGYRENNLHEMESPKAVLDEVCREKPIYLMGAGMHSSWCNSKALEIAGVTKDTKDPDPGVQFFSRLPNGEPDGNLIESDAMLKVLDALDIFRDDDVKCEAKKVVDNYNAMGVTSVQDGGAWGNMADHGRGILKEMMDEKEYNMRVQTCEFITSKSLREGVIDRIRKANSKYDDDYLRVDFLKVLDDGIFESKTCALVEPYLDGTNCDTLLTTEDLRDLFIEAAEAGFDICVHNIGDKTARDVLLGAKAVREAGYNDTRITSIHSILINDDDYGMFKDYSVIANASAQWCLSSPFKEGIIGDRAKRTFMLKTLKKLAPVLTFGSDHPADEFGNSPFLGIEMAITRQLYDEPDMPILLPLSERMALKDVIEAYTMGGAYQMRMEKKIGSIEKGKYADMIVLDQNLFEIDPHDIHNVTVDMTIFDGRIVYEA